MSGRDVYSGEYDRQVFQLYAEIKSERIKDTLSRSLGYLTKLNDAPVAKLLFIVAIAQILLFIATAAVMMRQLDWRMLIIPVLFLLSTAPRYVAWSSMETDADMICLFYSTSLMGLLSLVKSSINLFKAGVSHL